MQTRDLDSLTARLDRLEKDARRWRRLALFTGAALTAVLGLGLAGPTRGRVFQEELETRRLVLRDADGTQKGSIGLDDKGVPRIELTHDKALFFVGLEQPGLLLRDKGGRRGAFLGTDAAGSTRLELCSSKLVDGMRMVVKENGGSGVFLLDGTGRERVAMEFHEEVGGNLSNRDRNGRIRTLMGLDARDVPSFVLLDPAGRKRLGMLLEPDESTTPVFAMEDLAQKTRMHISAHHDGSPFLRLYRADGGLSYELP